MYKKRKSKAKKYLLLNRVEKSQSLRHLAKIIRSQYDLQTDGQNGVTETNCFLKYYQIAERVKKRILV